MNGIAPDTPCRFCILTRAAWRALRVALLPRTFAFIAALTVLVLMAPSSIPPFLPQAKPKAAPAAPIVAPAAPSGAAASESASASSSASPAGAEARAGAAAGPAKDAASWPAPGAGAASPSSPAGSAQLALADVPKWRFRTKRLLDPVVGQPWGPQPMLEQGASPFRMSFEQRPPELQWMDLDPEKGTLSGKPTQAGGPWAFELKVETTGKPDQFISQKYIVKVLGPAAPARLAGTASSPQAALRPGKPDLPGGPFTYRLEEDHLKELAADPKAQKELEDLIKEAQEGQAMAVDPAERARYVRTEAMARRELDAMQARQPPKVKGGEAASLDKVLAPLQDIDYPTEDLFRTALRLALCTHYPRRAGEAPPARTKSTGDGHAEAGDNACPGISKEGLLQVEAIVQRGRKPHPHNPELAFPWSATPGCGCVPPKGEDEVYGFVSYWGTAEQQREAPRAAAAAASTVPAEAAGKSAPVEVPRKIDFSLFTRIGFWGAALNDEGEIELPKGVREQGHRLVREAQRHGTRVDLVVHRSNWDTFLRRKDLGQLAASAADGAIKLLDDRPHQGWQRLLLPFWHEETYAFGGITVFFDNAPTEGSELTGPFRDFRKAFFESLVVRMQASGRSYRLNIVVPAEHMAATGPYAFADLTHLIEKAEPARTSKKVDAKEKADLYKGKTDITVTYMVLLPDPTTRSKKDLRERIDRSENPKGPRRVTLLESLVPVLMRPPASRPPWGGQAPEKQYADDLAYMKWNFAGVALWELPAQAKGDDGRLEQLKTIYKVESRLLPGLCDDVCPQRLWLRVLLQALVAVGMVALPLWYLSCAVRSWGLPYKIFLWAGGFVTAMLALALLQCDPALHELSDSNWPLVALVISIFAGGLYWSFKSRRPRP